MWHLLPILLMCWNSGVCPYGGCDVDDSGAGFKYCSQGPKCPPEQAEPRGTGRLTIVGGLPCPDPATVAGGGGGDYDDPRDDVLAERRPFSWHSAVWEWFISGAGFHVAATTDTADLVTGYVVTRGTLGVATLSVYGSPDSSFAVPVYDGDLLLFTVRGDRGATYVETDGAALMRAWDALAPVGPFWVLKRTTPLPRQGWEAPLAQFKDGLERVVPVADRRIGVGARGEDSPVPVRRSTWGELKILYR